MPFNEFEDDEQEFQPVVRKKPAQASGDDEVVRKPRPAITLDEDDAPKARRVVRSGWSGVDSVKTGNSDYAVRLKLTEDTQIIRFIGDAPYASYGQHWLERSGQK